MSLMLSFGVNQESDIIITVCLTAHGGGYLIVDQYVVVTSQPIPTQTISNKIANQMAVRQPEPSTPPPPPPPHPDCYPSYSVCQPEDIANVVSFLAGPDGGWVNGQVLRANGGFA
jgi:NAD(P)-dependent dehydrogenase (short-subunit alcohol dehydrogenase family)